MSIFGNLTIVKSTAAASNEMISSGIGPGIAQGGTSRVNHLTISESNVVAYSSSGAPGTGSGPGEDTESHSRIGVLLIACSRTEASGFGLYSSGIGSGVGMSGVASRIDTLTIRNSSLVASLVVAVLVPD
jgi:hypothetical protein